MENFRDLFGRRIRVVTTGGTISSPFYTSPVSFPIPCSFRAHPIRASVSFCSASFLSSLAFALLLPPSCLSPHSFSSPHSVPLLGAPTSKVVFEFLQKLFPRVSEAYGTMETGAITRYDILSLLLLLIFRLILLLLIVLYLLCSRRDSMFPLRPLPHPLLLCSLPGHPFPISFLCRLIRFQQQEDGRTVSAADQARICARNGIFDR